jgi:hypothetical protein
MSASTITAGYPVHRVITYRLWVNQHRVQFTDYTAACGKSDTLAGSSPFGRAGTARRLELCPTCFPGKTWGASFPDPQEIK